MDRAVVGRFLGGLVHDLRNPTATMRANVDFLRNVELTDNDAPEALDDIDYAITELSHGLERIDWIARWLCGHRVLKSEDGDVRQSLSEASIEANYGEGSLAAYGGRAVGAIVKMLIAASKVYGKVTVDVGHQGDEVVIAISDTGAIIPEKFLEAFFTMDGQYQMKSEPGGRYARYGGFVAAWAAAESIQARLVVSKDRAQVAVHMRAL